MVPSLVIVPSSSMAYWKGEVEYWLDDSSEVVFYSGPPGARQQIAANELWLQPGALDGKVRSEVDALTTRVPKPHIVVTSMESMLQVRLGVTNCAFLYQNLDVAAMTHPRLSLIFFWKFCSPRAGH